MFIKKQFAYRHATCCIDAKRVLKEIVMYYSSQRSDVFCTIVDLSKAYDRISTCLLCDEMRETDLFGQVRALIEFMGKNTFVCSPYGGQLSDEWKVKNGVLQGGIISGILFSFYPIESIF